MSGNRLTIFDTTLRDGEQAPGFSLRIDEKLAMARQLRTLGVDIIEAGFPIASDSDAEAVRMVATQVQGPVIAALARCHAKDIERAGLGPRARAAAPHSRLHRHVGPAPRAQAANVPRGVPARRDGRGQARARNHTDDVQFSAEDATRSDPDFLCQVIEAVIQSGAKTINLPDTVGYSTPDEVAEFFRTVIARVPSSDQVIFSAHCHDDLGLAVANTLAAVGAARGRSSARSTGSASAQATRRSKRSSWRSGCACDRLPFTTGINTQRDLHVEPAADRAHRRSGPGQQGDRRPQRVRARSGHPSGRHAEGSPDLRDHAARRKSASARRSCSASTRAGMPCRSGASRSDARWSGACSTRSIEPSSRTPIARRSSTTPISPPSSRA